MSLQHAQQYVELYDHDQDKMLAAQCLLWTLGKRKAKPRSFIKVWVPQMLADLNRELSK